MKKIRNSVTAMVMAMFMMFSMAACSSGGENQSSESSSVSMEGSWRLAVIPKEGVTDQENQEYIKETEVFYEEIFKNTALDIKSDGTVKITEPEEGKSVSFDGTWQYDEAAAVLTITNPQAEGDKQKTNYDYKDGKLYEQKDKPVFCFEKK